ncbi:oxidative stress-responsive serine-rich protein 1 [Gadus macrocephalus]|uniref:oxidative stress-responsive serine-rich protein 1 n=1 Tax=Gadus macrocephalus TaxID=80720 RepID=UPI0028CB912A|nr:oxidative stress-responsive serine-rich protein 1 [Gadus macrocephalus]XP_059926442.1 oxidative stress-responsive serine-rich protein 1 [Gadus macrocephalus]XP_059926443.1 oxidative stress-responsive serine-rich protein 1 [Gadus macrocephalus]XP_059926445.1 oxidative stress-responsive serine-rich protein 1 [Gadus macrocephalus]XP_059926446.1 oxidative stress-responsive serine-rich protein 1 [Gadus macrocephalus]XP_059926447.1 oxidative stress-responsive serine-rich protein 1 [Gadus macrocep
MEAGEKEDEETLQTAFKKLRVDAETSLPGTVNVCEALDPRAVPRVGPETSGAKPKLGCPKDAWHGCMRKTSRGALRSQRRRRSKSPILHPPKFTYCSSSPSSPPASLPPPGGCLKHQRLAGPEPRPAPGSASTSPAPPPTAQTQPPSAAVPAQTPPVFGARAGGPGSLAPPVCSLSPEAPGPPAQREGAEPSDFHALSQLLSGGPPGATGPGSPPTRSPCSSCSGGEAPEGGAAADPRPGCGCAPLPAPPPAGWPGVEVYSFTGLRGAISECERGLAPPRTPSSSSPPPPLTAGPPRSCSEQAARAYVDDINIEDLSGYMEYFLCIPKKMSHMAEMMYT